MNINKTDGWVKLHKSIMNSDLWRDKNAFMVFTTMLLMAHHEDNQGSIRFNGKQEYLKKGQFEISRSELSELLGMSPSTVRNAVERLKQDSRVDSKSDNHKTVYTICNWSKYQSTDDNNRTAKRTTTGQPLDNRPLSQKNKEVKNNSTNVLLAKPGNEEINKMFDYWENRLGYPITSKTTLNRRAAYNLHRKYKDDVYKLIDGVAMAQGEKFAPQISDFSELQSKLNNLLAWGKKRTDSRMEIIA